MSRVSTKGAFVDFSHGWSNISAVSFNKLEWVEGQVFADGLIQDRGWFDRQHRNVKQRELGIILPLLVTGSFPSWVFDLCTQ